MKGFFVTGTDTGVGKTFVTCALARKARDAGQKVFAFKPIETGVTGEWGEDQVALAEASASVPRGTFRLKLPAAPWVAAQAEGVEIDLSRVERELRLGADGANLVLVEAAGGWRVPITREHDTAELARCVGLPVLVVARAGLGTINHTLLTVEAITSDGLRAGAIVLSRRPEDDLDVARSNAWQIYERSGMRPYLLPELPSV
jgi:dethiobiotin synthetase